MKNAHGAMPGTSRGCAGLRRQARRSGGPVALMVAAALTVGSTGPDRPRELVEGFHAALIEAMRGGDKAGYLGRFSALEPAVTETFALGFMARRSVGGAWNEFSPEQQSAYLSKYAEWSVATFAGRFKTWSGERFETLSTSREDGTVAVDTQLVKRNGDTVAFQYKLREGNVGWRVVDLHIDGVSQLALTRSQYAGVLKQEGFDGLLRTLQQKIDEQRVGSTE